MDSRLSGPDVSLNAPIRRPIGRRRRERVDFLVDNKPLPDEIGWRARSTGAAAHMAAQALTRAVRTGIAHRARRAACPTTTATLEDLGEKLGISKERVRQIENRALEKLRTALTVDTRS